MRHLEGVVRPPDATFVAEDVLGVSFDGEAGDFTFEIAFPLDPAVTESVPHQLDPPYRVDAVISELNREGVGSWGYASNGKRMPDGQERAVAWMVEQLAIKVIFKDERSDAAFHDLAAEFGRAFNVWYRIALDWSELWSGPILSRGYSLGESCGQVRDVGQRAPDGVTGWGASVGSARGQFSDSALSRGILTGAFARANREQPPSPEWGLFLRGSREPDHRVAVIEAATATEVALTGALDARLSDSASLARELIAKNANGLVGLLRLLESIDGVAKSESLEARVADQLAGPRNDAVHRGSTPSNREWAFSTARAVLDRYSPLGNPDDDRLSTDDGQASSQWR